MVKINWTQLALSDLEDIHKYISDDSQRYAQITVNKIYDSVESLTRQPYSGRIVPEFEDTSIRELIEGNYRIVHYLVNEERIDILRIYHTARKMEKGKLK
jgi:addiction module RelE/StbE family toxin